MAKSILGEMTEMIFKQAQRLYETDDSAIAEEVERSKALDGLANSVRQNIATQVAVEKFRRDYGVAAKPLNALGAGDE